MSERDVFAGLPRVPSFTLTSHDVEDGRPLSPAQRSGVLGVPGGADVSPHLSWTGAPDGVKSYAVTVFDPDAPTGSGFWHWAVADIPGTVHELPSGAGNGKGDLLPASAIQVPNDLRAARYIGAAPPPGTGVHHYLIVVHALDVERIGVDADSTPAFLGFNIAGHILARAVLRPTADALD
jgi:Raf kinase inhibitor-like YbhB/YbcL family protein